MSLSGRHAGASSTCGIIALLCSLLFTASDPWQYFHEEHDSPVHAVLLEPIRSKCLP